MGGTEQLPIIIKQLPTKQLFIQIKQLVDAWVLKRVQDDRVVTDDAYGIIRLMNKNHKDYRV